MKHTVRKEAGEQVVAFSGDVDLESSPEARKLLLRLVEENPRLVVDLGGVEYLDSSGIATLVEAFQAVRKKGGRFALAAVSPSAMRVLNLARLDKVFPIHATVEEALAS